MSCCWSLVVLHKKSFVEPNWRVFLWGRHCPLVLFASMWCRFPETLPFLQTNILSLPHAHTHQSGTCEAHIMSYPRPRWRPHHGEMWQIISFALNNLLLFRLRLDYVQAFGVLNKAVNAPRVMWASEKAYACLKGKMWYISIITLRWHCWRVMRHRRQWRGWTWYSVF